MAATSSLPINPLSPARAEGDFFDRCRRQPVAALLVVASLLVLIYFFGFFKIFINGTQSAAEWSWKAWNAENNQEHCRFVLPISIFMMWFHRAKFRAAIREPWNKGIWVVAFGVFCFVLAARALQPRIAIFALPIIILGAVSHLWGTKAARVVLFPCVFMLFMIPIGGLVQGTVSLQILVTSVCNALASLIGMKIEATGTTIRSLDGSFNFEIAEGCSGIRSLMAMTTLTALYVHFTQNGFWRKAMIFASSIVFAVVGNIARIFTVVLVARFISPDFAAHIYHDYSAFIFFPAAVIAMVSFSHVINRDWHSFLTARVDPVLPESETDAAAQKPEGNKVPSPVSYDY